MRATIYLAMGIALAGCVSIDPDISLEPFLLDRMERAKVPGMAVGVVRGARSSKSTTSGWPPYRPDGPWMRKRSS